MVSFCFDKQFIITTTNQTNNKRQPATSKKQSNLLKICPSWKLKSLSEEFSNNNFKRRNNIIASYWNSLSIQKKKDFQVF